MLITEHETAPASAVIKQHHSRSRLIVAALCLFLSMTAAVPFFFLGRAEVETPGLHLQMPVTHDMHLHLEQMKSFYRGLAAGEAYPRWEEDTNRGFGAPTTNYYPPGIYYITSAFYALTGQWLRALLGTHLLLMIASAMAIYLYTRRMMSRLPAMVAMAAYIFLPYHIVDEYQRGAIAELLGFVWMPLILLFIDRLFEGNRSLSEPTELLEPQPRRRGLLDIGGLAVTYGAFLWSHPPTAYQFTLACGLLIAVQTIMTRNWKAPIMIGCAMAAGLALSAGYLYPAAVEQELIRHEYVSETWPYHATYVFFHDLKYAASDRRFFNLIDAIWMIGAFLIGLASIAILLTKFRERPYLSPLRRRVILLLVVGCFVAFMMTRWSEPLGQRIPKIDIGVFTWRMLAITTLVVACLAGACVQVGIDLKGGRSLVPRLILWSIAGLITVGGGVFSGLAVVRPMWYAPVFEPSFEHVNLAMIPRTAPDDPFDLPPVLEADLAQRKGTVRIDRWDPEHRSIHVDLSEPDRLLVRTFFFPGWTATVDGRSAQIAQGDAFRVDLFDYQAGLEDADAPPSDESRAPENDGFDANDLSEENQQPVDSDDEVEEEPDEILIRALDYPGWQPTVFGDAAGVVDREPLGDMVFDLDAGQHEVKLDFENTRARRLGEYATLGSALGLLLLVVIGSAKGRGKSSREDAKPRISYPE